jgi:type IV pilus assembly protein PilF
MIAACVASASKRNAFVPDYPLFVQRPHKMLRLLLPVLILAGLGGCTSTDDKPTVSVDGLNISEQKANSAASIYAQLGLQYMQKNNYKMSMNKLRKALELDPDLPSAYLYLAQLYARLEEYPDAETYYRKAIEKDPGYSRAHNNYGIFLCQRQRYAESEAQFLAALKDPLYDSAAQTLENIGICSLAAKQASKAEAYFKKALEKDPLLPGALFNLALMDYNHSRFQEAAINIERYRRVAQPSPASLWLGVNIQRRLGKDSPEASYAMLLENLFPASVETKMLKTSQYMVTRTTQ